MTAPTEPFVVRPGRPDEAPVVLEMFDESIAWMVDRGLSSQWGTEPFSTDPDRVAQCRRWTASPGFHLAESRRGPVAALVLGDAPGYVSPASGPEVYVNVLVARKRPDARGAGAHLVAFADTVAREQDISTLRVDCFAGNDGALVRFYESCGYTRTDTFTVGTWPGQVLERRLG